MKQRQVLVTALLSYHTFLQRPQSQALYFQGGRCCVSFLGQVKLEQKAAPTPERLGSGFRRVKPPRFHNLTRRDRDASSHFSCRSPPPPCARRIIAASQIPSRMSDSSRGKKRKRFTPEPTENGSTASLHIASAQEQHEATHPDPTAYNTDPRAEDDGEKSEHITKVSSENGDVHEANQRRLKKLENNYPAIVYSPSARLQSYVKLADLQALVLYILANGSAPQWVAVRHHQNFEKVVVLMVPGLDADLFTGAVSLNGDAAAEDPNPSDSGPDKYYPTKLVSEKLPEQLRPLAEIFDYRWPVKAPGDFNRLHSPMFAMLSSPIPRTKEEKAKKGPKPPSEGRSWSNKRTPITEFLTSKADLIENRYALHPAHLTTDVAKEMEHTRRHKHMQSAEDGWVDILDIRDVAEGAVSESEIEAGSILQGRRLLVIDCEMVTTTVDRFALARISILDWDGELVLDEFVKPPDPVKDYLTQYSGITKEMLDGTTTTLADIQKRLNEICTPRTILAGHSLDSDLRALKISYPFIVDTSLIYPHPKGPPQKSSLKWLSQKYLSREIQKNATTGHDSIEDARACLDLIRQKCEKGKAWGTSEASGESIFKRLARTGRVDPRLRPTPTDPDQPRRRGALVDRKGANHGFGDSADIHITEIHDLEVEMSIRDALRAKHLEGVFSELPIHDCDFVFARIRDLEYARGYSPVPEDEDIASFAKFPLSEVVSRAVDQIVSLHRALPPRTAFIVLSGSGPVNEMVRLQKMYAAFREEYMVKKWNELSVRWTDVEEQQLRRAVEQARLGLAMICVK